MLPLAHADPAETARPSSRDASVSSVPSIVTFRLCGSRCASEPLTWTPSIAARRPASRRSRSAARRAASAVISAAASAAAAPSPTMPGAFSVPGRRPRSWPPPSKSGARRTVGCRRAHVERADALRSVDLVRRDRQQVDAHRVDVERDAAEGLRRVGVEQDAAGARQAADRGERLQHADLVVGGHHADQDGLRLDGRFERREIDQAVGADRQHRDAAAARLEPRQVSSTARCSVATVTMWSPRSLRARGDALEREVVASVAPLVKTISLCDAPIRAATWRRAARRLAGPPAGGVVEAGGVADLVAQERQHRVEHAGVDRRGRVVVEVDHAGSWRRVRVPSTRSAAWIAATVKISG